MQELELTRIFYWDYLVRLNSVGVDLFMLGDLQFSGSYYEDRVLEFGCSSGLRSYRLSAFISGKFGESVDSMDLLYFGLGENTSLSLEYFARVGVLEILKLRAK